MNSTCVILDTNAVIRLFRGNSREISRAVMGATRIVIPLAAYAELKVGFELDEVSSKRESELLEELLATPGASVHRPDERTARLYAKIFGQIKGKGRMIPTNDIWIAAEAMDIGGVLYSSDKHFYEVPLLDWRYCE